MVSDGLRAGERVVVNGQLRVAPNAKVIVQSTLPGSETDTAVGSNPAGGGL